MPDYNSETPQWMERADIIRFITIENSVTGIGGYSFTGMENVTTINVEGAVSVGEASFFSCTSLECVYFKKCPAEIADFAFKACDAITQVIVCCYPQEWEQVSNGVGNEVLNSSALIIGHEFGDWVVIAEATCLENGEQIRYCSRCNIMETEGIPASGHTPGEPVHENEVEPSVGQEGGYDLVTYCTACGEELIREHVVTSIDFEARVRNVAASFEGKICLNYYISMPDDVREGVYAVITVNGRTVRIHASDAMYDSEGNGYRFSIDLYAKEIKDTVNLKFVNGSDVPLTFKNSSGTRDFTEMGVDYTVDQYVDYMIANGSTDSMKALARVAKDYCYAASNNFSGTTLELSSAVGSVTVQDLEGYKATREGELPNGVSISGITALFDSGNSFRFYLSYSGADPMAFTYAIDGAPAELQTTADGQYYLTVTNVAASKLHVGHTYTVSDGTTTFTMTASVLSYARSGITQGTTESAKMLSKALYLYNRAAYAYFGDN